MNLLQMSLSGAILIGFVILFRTLALRALPKRAFVIMWMVVLVRLLVPFSPLFGIEIASPERANYQTPAINETRNVPAAPERENQTAAVKPEQSDSTKPDTVSMPQKAERAEAHAVSALSRETVLTAVWATGAAFMGIFFAMTYRRGYRSFRKALPVEHEEVRKWMSAHPLRRCYTVKSFGGEESPMTYGVLCPVILAPGAPAWWNSEEAVFALEHEYVHMLRFDPALKMLLAAALTVHWMNPLVWVMYVLANRDIELSCDEAVLERYGEKSCSRYASALLSAEERKCEMPVLYAGFGTNTTSERIVEIMKYKKKSVLSVVLAAVMVLSLAACAATGEKSSEGFAISGESLDINNNALRPDGEASSIYMNADRKLLIPLEYNELLQTETPENDENGILFTVSEIASIEADQAQGGSGEGAGWLFSIGVISEIQLYDMLCNDMSGVDVFARDPDGTYYVYYHPTDVRMVRENYDDDESIELWTTLNEWAWSSVRDTFVAENDGLIAETFGNADLDIYLARAAFVDSTAYALSPSTWRPVTANGVYAEPYVMRLIRNAQVEALDNETTAVPDGEYIFLNFPNDDMRFDFFLAEGSENIYRQVWSGNEQLFRINFADGTTKASEIMQEWYDALAEADMMRELGYTPDDLIGRWAEKIAGRGVVTITQGAKGMYDVLVEWSNSAAEQYIWEMTARPTGAGGVLSYENGRHLIRTYESDGKFTEEVKYEDGTGEFYLNSAYELMWRDDIDGAGENTVFVNAG